MKRIFNYINEFYFFIKNFRYLEYVIDEYISKENSNFKKKIELIKLPWKVLFQGKEKDFYAVESKQYAYSEGNNQKESIYINGIMTECDKARYEAKQLSEVFGKPFTVFWNKSNGFFEDIYDCIRMKIGNKSDTSSKKLVKYIIHRVNKYNLKKIFIVGYSQGSIIASHAIEQLPKNIRDRVEINLLTMGSAQDSLHTYSKKGTAIHLCHTNDFVARMGVLNYQKKNVIKGYILEIPKDTHSFETYLLSLKNIRTVNRNYESILTTFKKSL
ncbi:hypothetical protein PBI_SCTP2_148 [Salicola phage SCTP-2]|nr:hypothetical protein PBI_SCTP2_148 [Salicola phage SCTP-2]